MKKAIHKKSKTRRIVKKHLMATCFATSPTNRTTIRTGQNNDRAFLLVKMKIYIHRSSMDWCCVFLVSIGWFVKSCNENDGCVDIITGCGSDKEGRAGQQRAVPSSRVKQQQQDISPDLLLCAYFFNSITTRKGTNRKINTIQSQDNTQYIQFNHKSSH